MAKKKSDLSKKLAKFNSDIKKKNAKFAKMSPAKKRMSIAEDVLASLKAKKYRATEGTYCELKTKTVSSETMGFNSNAEDFETKEVELQSLLKNDIVESCKVCAIGSLFVSKVSLGNKFKIDAENYDGKVSFDDYLSDDETLIKNLKGIFTEHQLRLMEYAFEGQDVDDKFYDRSDNFHNRVEEFYRSHKNPTATLTAIMQNIIKNKGTFKL